MNPLLVTLAESTPTTLTGALVAGVTGLAGAVVWLATRLLSAKDAHAAAITALHAAHAAKLEALQTSHATEMRTVHDRERGDIERVTTALATLGPLTEAIDRATDAMSAGRRR